MIAIVGIAGATETGSVDDLNALADAWARSDKGGVDGGLIRLIVGGLVNIYRVLGVPEQLFLLFTKMTRCQLFF